jgi:hypothetical protein
MKVTKKILALPIVLVSFVALAETVFDQSFYSTSFMDNTPVVKLEVTVPVKHASVVARPVKKGPKMQLVDLSQKDLINGKWEVVRVLDKNLNPVYDKSSNFEDKGSEIIVELDLISRSTVQINEDADQVFKISRVTKSGTIALFKPFENGYEVLEARRIKEVVGAKTVVVNTPEAKITQIEKRFEKNQELILFSALNPSKSREVLKGNKVSGSVYLMGDQVMFENVTLHVGDSIQTESLSFEAKIDGNTGHLNYNNEIQGIVSVVGQDEVRVRFSTGPLANAMLNFKVQDGSVDSYSNLENEDVREERRESSREGDAQELQKRETASRENAELERDDSYANEVSSDVEEEEVDLNEAGYDF